MSAAIQYTREETAGALSGSPALKQRVSEVESGDSGPVSDELLRRAQKLMDQQQSAGAVQRTVLLGVLLAELDGVPFEATAQLLDLKPNRLAKMMHGEESVPGNREKRWQALAESLHNLHGIIRSEATWRWLNTPIRDLGGQTPFEVLLKKSGPDKIRALTLSYLDPSFS